MRWQPVETSALAGLRSRNRRPREGRRTGAKASESPGSSCGEEAKWRDLQAHGAAPFNTVGELRPEVVAELLAAARATAEAAGVAPDCAADGEG